jgi:hypothetical protein
MKVMNAHDAASVAMQECLSGKSGFAWVGQ